MSAAQFNPRRCVDTIGNRARLAVEASAGGRPWTPATLYAAANALQTTRPRLAKRLHDLGANWSVNHRGVRDAS